jgi:hypothetical protein
LLSCPQRAIGSWGRRRSGQCCHDDWAKGAQTQKGVCALCCAALPLVSALPVRGLFLTAGRGTRLDSGGPVRRAEASATRGRMGTRRRAGHCGGAARRLSMTCDRTQGAVGIEVLSSTSVRRTEDPTACR